MYKAKTLTDALEFVKLRLNSGDSRRVLLVAPTMAEAHLIAIKIVTEWDTLKGSPLYHAGKGVIDFPDGAEIRLASSGMYSLRGLLADLAWAHDVGRWQHMETTWDELMMCARLGPNPIVLESYE
jgi:phage terminase large subunit-like protein